MGDIVRKQKNGKFLGWYVRYIDSDGRRKQRASHQPTKALARRFLVEIEARVARGQCGLPEAAPPPRELSVAELCELYVTGYSRPRIKNLAQYRTEQRSALRRILPQLGARLCSAVAAGDIRRLRDNLAERRNVRLGAMSLSKVEVLDGLAPGERVVTGGSDNFKGADRVVITP